MGKVVSMQDAVRDLVRDSDTVTLVGGAYEDVENLADVPLAAGVPADGPTWDHLATPNLTQSHEKSEFLVSILRARVSALIFHLFPVNCHGFLHRISVEFWDGFTLSRRPAP